MIARRDRLWAIYDGQRRRLLPTLYFSYEEARANCGNAEQRIVVSAQVESGDLPCQPANDSVVQQRHETWKWAGFCHERREFITPVCDSCEEVYRRLDRLRDLFHSPSRDVEVVLVCITR